MSSRKALPTALALGLTLAAGAHADEGMWMPTQLPELAKPLQAAGFKGNPADLANVTAPPLSAVVRAGGGTGSFVSADGLLLTNHHVAMGVIQYNSSPEHDLITGGFIANGRADERPANPDFRVLVTVGFDKVTDQVLAQARGKTGRAYFDAVDAASKQIVAECEKDGSVRCSVANMYYGTDFYRIAQLELSDVRLVYAPPRAIGNYGDEIDNFMWPRHTGDFTLLRAYVGKDGKPAAYSKDNVPYQAPAHLQMSVEGPKEGDYAMLAGYPGITYRHRTAAEFAGQIDTVLPRRVSVFQQMIDTIEAASAKDAQARTRYASQLQSLKNNRKRAAGELEGLLRSDAKAQRAADETAMLAATDRKYQGDIKALLANLSQGAAVGERDLLLFGALGGRGLSRYTADLTGSGLDAVVGADGRLDALDLHGGFVGYTHYWSELWRSNLIFGQLTLERNAALAADAFRQSRYGVFNLIWSPAPSWTMGMEVLYGRLEQQGGARGDTVRVQGSLQYNFIK